MPINFLKCKRLESIVPPHPDPLPLERGKSKRLILSLGRGRNAKKSFVAVRLG
jgi:hypothetical protein